MKRGRVIAGIVVLFLALAACAFVMFGGVLEGVSSVLRGEVTPAAESFREVVSVQRGDLEFSIRAVGEAVAPASYSLSFPIAGSARLAEVMVEAGDEVHAGDLLMRLDTADIEAELKGAEEERRSAEKALEEAGAPADAAELATKRLALLNAEDAVREAEKALDEARAPDIASLQRAVEEAERKWEQERLAYEDFLKEDIGPDIAQIEEMYAPAARTCAALSEKENPTLADEDVRWKSCNEVTDAADEIARRRLNHERERLQREHAVELARRQWLGAKDALEAAGAGPDELAVAEAEYRLAKARADLARAGEELERAEQGPPAYELADEEAAASRARRKADLLRAELERAVLRAPADATVVGVYAAPRDMVSASSTVAELADLSSLRVRVDIDETQIADVEEGMPARIRFDALPDQVSSGHVLAISVQGVLLNELMYYPVFIALDAPPPELRLGMTAEVEIINYRAEDVLLVPAAAVRRLPDGDAVTVLREDPAGGGRFPERRYVTVGRSNGIYTEIVDGLEEGDEIEVWYELPTMAGQF